MAGRIPIVRADRLLSIVLLLQSRGRLSARQLAAELEVSARTIYRDVVALSGAGIPIYADASGYRLVDGYQTQLTGLTAEEARGLVLAGLPAAAADLGLAKAVAAAQLKLSAALPAAQRELASRMRQRFYLDAPGWYEDGDAPDHLGPIADAVWRQRVIEMRYENWTRIVSHRLEPYGLVLKAGKWYLVGRVARGIRTFRVSQIRELIIRDEEFAWPDGFDLAGYWREQVIDFRSRLHQGDALVRLHPDAIERLPHLLGRAAAEAAAAGETQADGWTVARVPIETESYAEAQFLRLGAQVEVLEPASLRERLTGTVAALASLYQPDDTATSASSSERPVRSGSHPVSPRRSCRT